MVVPFDNLSSFNQAIAIETSTESITYAQLDELTSKSRSEPAIVAHLTLNTIITLISSLRAGQMVVMINPKVPYTPSIDVSDIPYPGTIVWTSGSTGLPKAAILSFDNHYYNAIGSFEINRLELGDKWLLRLPLFHVSGLSIVIRCLLRGATICLPNHRWSIEHSLDFFKPTHCSLVMTQLQELVQTNTNVSMLKTCLVGGGPISDSLIQSSTHMGLPVMLTYGCTEMASQIITNNRVLPYRELKINSNGHVLVKGKTLFNGYVGMPIALDSDGFFNTGDVASFNHGQFTFLGRVDRMFVSGGENIYPEEIERVLLSHPSVYFARVESIPSSKYGYRPVAFVSRKDPLIDLDAYVRQWLPTYKCPDRYFDN